MHRQRFGILFLVCTAATVTTGCGGGPESASVRGEVLVDGKPLESGIITFTGLDGKTATANIQSGKYDLRTSLGKNRVQISAPIVTGKRKEYNAPNAPLVEITEESLQDKYHTQSTLTFDVQSGSNIKDWTAESKSQNHPR
jgi:hypothetical protein